MKRMLLGVGNRLSHDDGVGPVVATSIDGSSGWIAIDCGTSFENVAGLVLRERPDVLVIVDAAQMGTDPGTVLRLPMGTHDRMLASTHGLPLSFVLGNLKSAARDTAIIGVEPADLSLGEGLSMEVSRAAHALIRHLETEDLDSIPFYSTKR